MKNTKDITEDLNVFQLQYQKGEIDLTTLINRVYNYGYSVGLATTNRPGNNKA